MSKPKLNKTFSSFSRNPELNRAFEVRRDTDNIKTPKCTIYDVDFAMLSYLQDIIKPQIFENNKRFDPNQKRKLKSDNELEMPDEVIEALRNGTKLPDTKLQALHDFTKALLDKRGHIGDDKLNEFLNAGYTKRQALEVLTGLASKLISNFTNALTHTKVDDAMKPYAWEKPEK